MLRQTDRQQQQQQQPDSSRQRQQQQQQQQPVATQSSRLPFAAAPTVYIAYLICGTVAWISGIPVWQPGSHILFVPLALRLPLPLPVHSVNNAFY